MATLFAEFRRRRRVRWFSEQLKARRDVRALGKYMWDRTEAITPFHKVMRLGFWWYVSEFDGRKWRVCGGRHATSKSATIFVMSRMNRQEFRGAAVATPAP